MSVLIIPFLCILIGAMREEIIRKHADEAVVWRHWLHAHPEISTKELTT